MNRFTRAFAMLASMGLAGGLAGTALAQVEPVPPDQPPPDQQPPDQQPPDQQPTNGDGERHWQMRTVMSSAQVVNGDNQDDQQNAARPVFTINFDDALSQATYRIEGGQQNGETDNQPNLTEANLHCARAGEEGPVVATLQVQMNGDNATLRNADIQETAGNANGCDVRINNVASLLAAALEGQLYVQANGQDAEQQSQLRGQLFPQFWRGGMDELDDLNGNDDNGILDDLL